MRRQKGKKELVSEVEVTSCWADAVEVRKWRSDGRRSGSDSWRRPAGIIRGQVEETQGKEGLEGREQQGRRGADTPSRCEKATEW